MVVPPVVAIYTDRTIVTLTSNFIATRLIKRNRLRVNEVFPNLTAAFINANDVHLLCGFELEYRQL